MDDCSDLCAEWLVFLEGGSWAYFVPLGWRAGSPGCRLSKNNTGLRQLMPFHNDLKLNV